MVYRLFRGWKRGVVAKEREGKKRKRGRQEKGKDFATHFVSLRNKFTLLESDELDEMSQLLSLRENQNVALLLHLELS